MTDQGRGTSFSASIDLPSGSGPFPAVIVYGGFGTDTVTVEDAGAAVIGHDPCAVGAEGTSRDDKRGAFHDVYGSSSGTGPLMAWAWGASRVIDVLEQSGEGVLRADATGVTGCSRYGKGAFVAGAFDQRVALTMPIESGTGGALILREVARESGAQLLSSAYGEQSWLGDTPLERCGRGRGSTTFGFVVTGSSSADPGDVRCAGSEPFGACSEHPSRRRVRRRDGGRKKRREHPRRGARLVASPRTPKAPGERIPA